MAQAGNLVVLGDAGEALGDSIYEARLFVRGEVKSLGADCIEKAMRREQDREMLAELLEPRRRRGSVKADEFRATARPASSTISTSTTPPPTDETINGSSTTRTTPRVSATFDHYSISGDPARRRDRHLRHPRRRRQAQASALRRPAVPRRLDVPLSARRLSREVRHRRRARHPLRQEADRAEDPGHHRRHELRRAVRCRPRRRSAAAPAPSAPRPPPATAA